LCLTLGPVAVYLLLLGAISLSRRPLLVSGARDMAALALAVSGFLLVGPVELFFPDAAADRFGPFIWIILLAFYSLCLLLVLLLLRPRLIVYNISTDRLRPILEETAAELDAQSRWAGDGLVMPTLGIQLYLDRAAGSRHVSLISAGPKQSHQGWRRLETALAAALSSVEVPRSFRGARFLCAGVLLATLLAMAVSRDSQAIAQALFDKLRL